MVIKGANQSHYVTATESGDINALDVSQVSSGWSDTVAPTVTAGAYSAGDIMGALIEIDTGAPAGSTVIVQELQFVFKNPSAVPSLTAIFFDADPTATTKTDNAAYSLNAADAFKVLSTFPVNALGGYATDHGTPISIVVKDLASPMKLASGSSTLYMLLIDNTGITPGSTSDLQVRVSGI